MKIATMTKTALAVTVMAVIAVIAAPIASAVAYPITGKLGNTLSMTDTVGQVELTWKVSNLQPSSDVVPEYPVAGQLWEATATVNAVRGPRHTRHLPVQCPHPRRHRLPGDMASRRSEHD